MQIKCDKCKAVYSIADNVIGSNGRKVKCAKCDYIWQVNLPISEEPFKLNPIIHSHYITWILKLSSIILFTLICYVGYLNFPNFSNNISFISNLYKKQLPDTEGITLEDVKYKIIDNNLVITGNFINNSDEDKSLPAIRYSILDENKKTIFSKTQDFPEKKLSPDKTHKINAKIIHLSLDAEYLELEVGNQPEDIMSYSLIQDE